MPLSRSAGPTRFAGLVAVLFLLCGGCGSGDDEPEDLAQTLTLELRDGAVPVPLDAMDVWVSTGASRAEPFEIHGEGTAIVGTLPREVHVGYEENWRALLGKAIPISSRGGDPDFRKPCVVTVPGVGQFRVIGGTFTIDIVGTGRTGRTPLTGRIELRVRGPSGEVSLRGSFTVNAMTWG
jgi:hypothetical protein